MSNKHHQASIYLMNLIENVHNVDEYKRYVENKIKFYIVYEVSFAELIMKIIDKNCILNKNEIKKHYNVTNCIIKDINLINGYDDVFDTIKIEYFNKEFNRKMNINISPYKLFTTKKVANEFKNEIVNKVYSSKVLKNIKSL